jgi:hypothetical protein
MALAIRQFDNIIPPFAAEPKHCPRCGEDLPRSEFGVCRARKDGLNLYCKKCIRQKIRLFRQAVREYKKAQLKHMRSVRPEQSIASRRYSDQIGYRLTRHAARLLRRGTPCDRVREAIKRGAHTQPEIARATKLPKDEVCDAIAELLLWTGEIRTQVVRTQRMYFVNETEQPKKPQPGRKPLNSFSSIGVLMPGAKPASHRRKTA